MQHREYYIGPESRELKLVVRNNPRELNKTDIYILYRTCSSVIVDLITANVIELRASGIRTFISVCKELAIRLAGV